MTHEACSLCEADGGEVIVRTPRLRVIRADEPGFPAFYRVVWQAHVAEFSQLEPADRQHCMEAVAAVEQVLREHLRPVKVNLAALGNMVPHLHWHVIARFEWDSHYPAPVWAAARREVSPGDVAGVVSARRELEAAMVQRLLALGV
ncbi:MAG: HIT family protein [Ramlibacter sp.]|nr:HIT family protein [Ramlibacter sp.]